MAQKAEHPKTAEDYVHLGNRLRKRGQQVEACQAYDKATKLAPESADAYGNWGDLLLRRSEYAEAVDKYLKAIKVDANSIDYDKWISALENLDSREQAKATENFEQIVGAGSSNAFGYARWAEALVGRKRYSDADEKFSKAVELDSKNEAAYKGWGDSLYERGEYEDAVEKYLAAARIDSDSIDYEQWLKVLDELRSDERTRKNAELDQIVEKNNSAPAYKEWAGALVALERYEEAYEKYGQVVAINHEDAAAFGSWGDALQEEKKYQDAIEKYLSAIAIQARCALSPGKVKTRRGEVSYNSWISALESLNRFQRQEAIDQFRKIVTDSKYSSAYRNWGDALFARGQFNDACEQYRAAIDLDPSDVRSFNGWAFALLKMNEPAKAAEKYRGAVTINPDYAATYINWAELLFDQKDYQMAVETYVLAIKAQPTLPDYHKWISALAECKAEEREKITKQLWEFASDNSDYASFYHEWGAALAEKKDYASAIGQYRKAIALDPDDREAQVGWANALVASGGAAEALRMYLTILEHAQGNVEASQLVDLLDQLNEADKRVALTRIHEIAGDDPEYASTFKGLGSELYNRKRFDEAIQMYEPAIELDCEDAQTHYFWGLALSSLQRNRDSIEMYQHSIDADPQYGDAYHAWGVALLWLKDYSGAIEKLAKAIELSTYPRLASYAYMNWGVTAAAMGDYEASLEKYERAAQIAEPQDAADAYFTWGNGLLEAKYYEEAREKFRRAIEADPDNKYATYSANNIGDSFFREGRYAEGREAWEKAREAYARNKQQAIDNLDADYFLNYGSMLQSIFGKLDEAEEIYQQGLRLDPTSVWILTNLVGLYFEKKDERAKRDGGPSPYWKARDYYQRAARLLRRKLDQADDPGLPFQFGQLLVTLGDYMTQDEMVRAEDYLQKALAKDPNSADTYTNLGVLNNRKKDFTKAIQYFTDAFKLKPDDLNVWSNLAEAYLKAATTENADPGLKEKAEAEFRKILQAAPNHVESIIGLGEVYKAMGDVAKDEDLYARAIEQFDEGIRIADSAAGSKKLKRRDCAAAQYSAGYSKVKLYEAATTARDESLLTDALGYFNSAKGNDPENFKAKRAAERIERRLRRYTSQRVLERLGPPVIISGAGIIFLVTQMVFLLQWPINMLLRWPISMAAGAYATLSFGALLFTVAGLSLPQLLKLKVAGIELEKSAVEQITTAGALGISK
ncbi:MAG TPA: tetratricopeptide repeat protein [Pyrinomonadaceae bacterium]|nr:tetratricopeptide repeat protein [Pyrinomonadaceae bacterium]